LRELVTSEEEPGGALLGALPIVVMSEAAEKRQVARPASVARGESLLIRRQYWARRGPSTRSTMKRVSAFLAWHLRELLLEVYRKPGSDPRKPRFVANRGFRRRIRRRYPYEIVDRPASETHLRFAVTARSARKVRCPTFPRRRSPVTATNDVSHVGFNDTL